MDPKNEIGREVSLGKASRFKAACSTKVYLYC